jgi:hypothetical protein
MRTLTLTIYVPPENVAECVDAINETLNDLARNDVLIDDFDDAWKWENAGVDR